MTTGFLTLAFGRMFYRDMARALVQSARARGLTLPFAVVTDSTDKQFCALFDLVIPYRKEYGRGVEQKLYLDRYAPFDCTIFVDADSLFFGNPDAVAAYYADKPGFVVRSSGYVDRGERYYALKDVGQFLDACAVNRLPRFNSGLLAFDRTDAARAVFEKARAIFAMRETNGLKEFKTAAVADEPVFAAALASCAAAVYPEDGTFLAVMSDEKRALDSVSAAVVHFNIFQQDSYVYARERLRLRFAAVPLLQWVVEPIARTECFCRNAAAQAREFLLTRFLFPVWGLFRKLFPKKRKHV
jgi:hypothetical protein